MRNPHIPDYYTDKKLTDEEKLKKDWEMIAGDFPLPQMNSNHSREG